jgi:hypothetical protein
MSVPVTPPAALARSRRAFLRAVGQGATALPFYRLLEASAVHAAPGDAPQRFIGIFAPHGITEPYFRRRPGETETSYDLRFADSVLAPFDDAATYGRSFRDRVTTVEGLDLVAAIEKKTQGHETACVLLTGSAPNDNRVANESLDQYLAVTRGLGASTHFSSVVLGVGTRKTESGHNISYAAGGVPLPKIIDPAVTFQRLFANLYDPTDAAGQAVLAGQRRRGKSVIDFLRKDIGRLAPRLAAPERMKLDQHLGSLRELEKQLAAAATGPAAGAACHRPMQPDPAEFPKVQIDDDGEPYLDRITELQVELLAQAIACDLTRFATLFIGLTDDIHENVAHAYVGPQGPDMPGMPATWVALGARNRLYYGQCARLLQRLAELDVLDSSLVLMTSDLGDPAQHSVRNVPTILAGGANGRVKMGRRIVLAEECGGGSVTCSAPRLVANNKLLVSLAQAFGAGIDAFGTTVDPSYTSGALTELLGGGGKP